MYYKSILENSLSIAFLILLLTLFSNCDDRVVTEPEYEVYDLRRPGVSHHTPLDEAEDVPLNTSVQIWFDKLMNTSSVEGNVSAYRVVTADLLNSVTAHSANPDVLYAGKSNGGIFKSTNGGDDWVWISEELPRLDVIKIAVSPVNPSLVFITTSSGVFKSENEGDDWTPVKEEVYSAIALSRIDQNTLYIASEQQGVLKSTDGGSTWNSKNSGLRVGRPLTDIKLGHTDENVLLLSSVGDFVYRSLDAAESWIRLRNGLDSRDFNTIAFSATDDNTIYAGSRDGKLFTSEDLGDTWVNVSSNLPPEGSLLDILTNPSNRNEIIVAKSEGIYKSTDAGINWSGQAQFLSSSGTTLSPGIINSLIYFPGSTTRLVAATNSGAFISRENSLDFVDKSKVNKDNLYVSGTYSFEDWKGEQMVVSNLDSAEVDTTYFSPYVLNRALTLWIANGRKGDPPVDANPTATKMTFKPNTELVPGWLYKVTILGTFLEDLETFTGIRGAEDINGNSFETSSSFTFTTNGE